MSALERERLASIQGFGNSVTFSVGVRAWLRFGFGFRRRGLSVIDGGSIEVVPGDPGRIRFEASTRLFTAIYTVFVIAITFMMQRDLGLGSALWIGPVAWLWLVGINYVMGRTAVREFVTEMVDLDAKDPDPTP